MRSAPAVVVFFALLFAFTCVQAEERLAEELADGTGFSYALPPGWKAVEKPNQKFKILTNEANAINGLAPNIIVKEGAFQGTLKAFAELTQAGFKKAYPNFTELGSGELRTDAGADFIRVIATNEINGHKVRQSFFMYAGAKDLKVALTCTLRLEIAERFDGALEITAKSFRFEKGTVVSTVLSAHFDDLMKLMVAYIKENGELGKDVSDDDIKVKALDPVYDGLNAAHMLEVSKRQERDFAAGKFLDDSNQKILNDLCSFMASFHAEKTVASKFIVEENKAGKLKGADLEVAIRIMKWSLLKLKDALRANQKTKDLNHAAPPIGPKPPTAEEKPPAPSK